MHIRASLKIQNQGFLSKVGDGIWRGLTKFKIVAVLIGVIWAAVSMGLASEVPGWVKIVKVLPPDHWIMFRTFALLDEFYYGVEANVRVYLYFGVKGLDKSNVSRWSTQEWGEIIWDDDFDLSSEENQ